MSRVLSYHRVTCSKITSIVFENMRVVTWLPVTLKGFTSPVGELFKRAPFVLLSHMVLTLQPLSQPPPALAQQGEE